MTLDTLTAFFGWMLTVNLGLFLLAVLTMWLFRDVGMRLHASMFGLREEDLTLEWYRYLGNYKIAIIVLNLVPYLSLQLFMS